MVVELDVLAIAQQRLEPVRLREDFGMLGDEAVRGQQFERAAHVGRRDEQIDVAADAQAQPAVDLQRQGNALEHGIRQALASNPWQIARTEAACASSSSAAALACTSIRAA